MGKRLRSKKIVHVEKRFAALPARYRCPAVFRALAEVAGVDKAVIKDKLHLSTLMHTTRRGDADREAVEEVEEP